jgi:hypothetical protein
MFSSLHALMFSRALLVGWLLCPEYVYTEVLPSLQRSYPVASPGSAWEYFNMGAETQKSVLVYTPAKQGRMDH